MPIEKTIENTDQLRAEFPDLVKQIEAAATAGIDTAAIENTARESERDRIIGLAAIQFGDEKGAKFKAVVETGVTVEAFRAVMDATGGNAETDETDAEAAIIKAKADALNAINNAGPPDPGADNTQSAGGDNYMQLVADYQRENKCSKFIAMQAISRSNPEVRQKYIDASQAG